MRYLWGSGIGALAAITLANSAHAELIVSPETITLTGERSSPIAKVLPLPEGLYIPGDRSSLVSTTLTLSDDEGIKKLTPAVSDLRRADGAAFIPAASIEIEPEIVSVPIDAPKSIKITVDFAEASANGEFTGSLYLHHEGGRQVIPITVRGKTAPLWPWGVMILGVLLGTGLSFYRAEGRSRDEIVIQVGRLRNQMRGDVELHEDFKTSIESELVDVESAVEDKDWETAKAELVDAKTLWSNWRKDRVDWIAQLKYGQKLFAENYEQLPEPTKKTIYMQQVQEHLDAIYRRLRTGQYESPQPLSKDFSKIRREISQYTEGEALVKQLKAVRSEAKLRAREQFWLSELQLFEDRLKNLSPDEESYQAWKSSLEAKKQELEKEIADLEPQESTQRGLNDVTGRSSDRDLPVGQQILPAPTTSSIAQPKQVERAERNLFWFNQTARAVSIILLAWLGMIDLYGNKPIFGADPLRDYFALLAWGFGAEVTRESVVRATQDQGVPLTKVKS